MRNLGGKLDETKKSLKGVVRKGSTLSKARFNLAEEMQKLAEICEKRGYHNFDGRHVDLKRGTTWRYCKTCKRIYTGIPTQRNYQDNPIVNI